MTPALSPTVIGQRPTAPICSPPPTAVSYVRRFDARSRALHLVVMVTFLGLSATGMPLLFSDAAWARGLAMIFGGFHGAGILHRIFGVTLLGAVGWHLVDVCWRGFVRGE